MNYTAKRSFKLNIIFIILSLLCLLISTRASILHDEGSTYIYNENDLDHPSHSIPNLDSTIPPNPPNPNLFNPTSLSPSQFTPQQESKKQISIHFFPTPSSTNRTLFHALILCDMTRQGITTYICTSNLFLHISWTDTTGLTELSHAWIQVYHPDYPILQEITMKRTFASVGFPLLNTNTNLLRFNELHVFGEFVWEKFEITSSLMFSVQIPNTGTLVSASTHIVSTPMMDITDITSTFEYKKYEKEQEPPIISQQLWIKDIPYPYSTIYIHVAGWVGVPDEIKDEPKSLINCTLNSANATQVKYEYQDHLEIGFSVRALDPITNKPITFPIGTDVVLLCSGFDLDSNIDINGGGIPAIGLHAQIYEYRQPYDFNATNSNQKSNTIPITAGQAIYYQTVINSPDPTYKIRDDPTYQQQFGFFHVNDTNPYLYAFVPIHQLIWTGNTKQPLTNSKKCISLYQMRFGLNFTNPPGREFKLTSIPITIGLGATENLQFHSANWLLIFNHDESTHFVDGSGQFSIINDDAQQNRHDSATQRQQIRFEKALLQPDQYGFATWGWYEVLISISLYCRKTGGDQASLFFSYESDDIITIDHRKMSYLSVFGYSNSPFRLVSGASEPNKASNMRALMNRVNLTVATEFKESDLIHQEGDKATYRYTFNIWLHDIPSHVRHTKENHIIPELQTTTPIENNMSINPNVLLQSTNQFNNQVLLLSSQSQYQYTNHLYQYQEQQYKQNRIMINNNDVVNDDETNIELYSPFVWVEFTFIGSFLFHGNYSKCKIWDGDEFFDIRPKMYYMGQLYDIPDNSDMERLSFNFEFINNKKRQKELERREKEQRDGGKVKPEKDIHIYSSFHISCQDVHAVNFTNIVFNTEHEEHFIERPTVERNWHDPENTLLYDDPRSIGFQARFSHYFEPKFHSNWFFMGTLAEFDTEAYDQFETFGFFHAMFMLFMGLILFGIWIYSGTSRATRHAIHRSTTKTQQQRKLIKRQ